MTPDEVQKLLADFDSTNEESSRRLDSIEREDFAALSDGELSDILDFLSKLNACHAFALAQWEQAIGGFREPELYRGKMRAVRQQQSRILGLREEIYKKTHLTNVVQFQRRDTNQLAKAVVDRATGEELKT